MHYKRLLITGGAGFIGSHAGSRTLPPPRICWAWKPSKTLDEIILEVNEPLAAAGDGRRQLMQVVGHSAPMAEAGVDFR